MKTPASGKKLFQLHPLFLISFLMIQSILFSQVDIAYSFIAAGHAYGAHSGTNPGLHPALLNSFDSGFDPGIEFIVFTGDIVNYSTVESWQQVENEMSHYPFDYYYVMGNHGNNDIGWQVFENKYGAGYYSFTSHNELYIVLNSTESDRSISSAQLDFLKENINAAEQLTKNIFIFFHEILWNSDEKYIGVRSNSRSRYDQIVNYSNYWQEVHPFLSSNSEMDFYLITGDVGGNPDAIAAFYDKRDNVTFISSGMGEVEDENYLQVNIYSNDSIAFDLFPLDPEMTLDPLYYYSVPEAPDSIFGPVNIDAGNSDIEYYVEEIFNAETYLWELSNGISGFSTMNSIEVDFSTMFGSGTISVKAEKDGFGLSSATSIHIESNSTNSELFQNESYLSYLQVLQDSESIRLKIFSGISAPAYIKIYNSQGKAIFYMECHISHGLNEINIAASDIDTGVYLFQVSTANQHTVKKIMLW